MERNGTTRKSSQSESASNTLQIAKLLFSNAVPDLNKFMRMRGLKTVDEETLIQGIFFPLIEDGNINLLNYAKKYFKVSALTLDKIYHMIVLGEADNLQWVNI